MTGTEVLIGKAAITAAVRAGGALASSSNNSMQRRQIRKHLRQSPDIASLERYLTGGDRRLSAKVEELIGSAEIEHVSFQVASSILTEGKRKAKSQLAEVQEQLHALIVNLNIDAEFDTRVLADKLFDAISGAVALAIAEVHPGGLPSRVEAGLVKTVSSRAASCLRNRDLLESSIDVRDVEDFERAMQRQVRALHSSMRLPHAGTKKQIPYAKLYVQPELCPGGASSTSGTFSVSDLLESSIRSVILGDPGGGKSTLAAKLAFDLASGRSVGTSARVPFLIVLREYVKIFADERNTVRENLLRLCKSPYNVETTTEVLEYLLLNGLAVVMFDGLDELTDTSLRTRVVQLVEGFAHMYPTCQIIVTSRRVGYDQAPLDEDLFKVVELSDFTPTQVSDYARNWFSLDESIESHRRTRLTDSFLADSSFVDDLRKNPLMLSLMCGIYASENYIPRNRPEVYEKCALVLFDRWDKQRGIEVALPFDAHIKNAMRSLALWLYSEPIRQQGLTRDRLVRYMTTYLREKRFDNEDEAENAASSFVDFCTGRAWVLTDLGSNPSEPLYGFTHRTFLEYFAASQLVRANTSAESLFSALRDKIRAEEWDVVCQLALQIIGANVEDGADDFLTLVLAYADGRPTQVRRNLILFAARSLAFIVPRPEVLRSICNAAADDAARFIVSNRRRIYPKREKLPLSSLFNAAPENLTNISKYLRERLNQVKSRKNQAEALLAALLFPSDFGDYSRDKLDGEHREYWRTQTAIVIEDSTEIVSRYEDTAEWLNVLQACRGDRSLADIFEKFGPRPMFSVHWAPGTTRQPIIFEMLQCIQGDSDTFDRHIKDWRKFSQDLVVQLLRYPPPWYEISIRDDVVWSSVSAFTQSVEAVDLVEPFLILGAAYVTFTVEAGVFRREFSDLQSSELNILGKLAQEYMQNQIVVQPIEECLMPFSISREGMQILDQWRRKEISLIRGMRRPSRLGRRKP